VSELCHIFKALLAVLI